MCLKGLGVKPAYCHSINRHANSNHRYNCQAFVNSKCKDNNRVCKGVLKVNEVKEMADLTHVIMRQLQTRIAVTMYPLSNASCLLPMA